MRSSYRSDFIYVLTKDVAIIFDSRCQQINVTTYYLDNTLFETVRMEQFPIDM
jgi:hypothetical protein